uniref:Uncharacterized protein n=1 Tax=Heterorhabditis bacteriophora TaxID=37862 RepID=A0A1I7XTC2_HETBA
MTKLGVTPGVHGDGGDDKGEVKPEAIKIDPKVGTLFTARFTILLLNCTSLFNKWFGNYQKKQFV